MKKRLILSIAIVVFAIVLGCGGTEGVDRQIRGGTTSNTPSQPGEVETERGAVKACQNRVREERPSHMVKFMGALPPIHDEIGWVIEGKAEIGGRTYDYGCELVFVGGEWQIVDFMLD